MFMGKAERRLIKPECISPEIERQRARADTSWGSRPASGNSSLRYSAMASVSHTLTDPLISDGTRKDGDRSRSSARIEGSSEGAMSSSKSSPAILHNNQPRSDHEP